MSELLYHFPGPRFRIRDGIEQAFRRGMCHPLMLLSTFAIGAGFHWLDSQSDTIFAGLVGVWVLLSLGVPLACAGIAADRRCPFRDVLKATSVAFVWAVLVNGLGFFLRTRYVDHRGALDASTISDVWTISLLSAGLCFFAAIVLRLCAPKQNF